MAVDPAKDEDKAAVMAATARLTRITGKTTLGGAVDEVEVWRLSHLKLEEETKVLAAERAALELSKRKENAVTLTKLGAETPHTSGLGVGKLCTRLLTEPLDEQSARVAALLAARGGKLPEAAQQPVADTVDGLTVAQLAKAKKAGIDPAKYAATLMKMSGKA
jgi:hypothetical protein